MVLGDEGLPIVFFILLLDRSLQLLNTILYIGDVSDQHPKPAVMGCLLVPVVLRERVPGTLGNRLCSGLI